MLMLRESPSELCNWPYVRTAEETTLHFWNVMRGEVSVRLQGVGRRSDGTSSLQVVSNGVYERGRLVGSHQHGIDGSRHPPEALLLLARHEIYISQISVIYLRSTMYENSIRP